MNDVFFSDWDKIRYALLPFLGQIQHYCGRISLQPSINVYYGKLSKMSRIKLQCHFDINLNHVSKISTNAFLASFASFFPRCSRSPLCTQTIALSFTWYFSYERKTLTKNFNHAIDVCSIQFNPISQVFFQLYALTSRYFLITFVLIFSAGHDFPPGKNCADIPAFTLASGMN